MVQRCHNPRHPFYARYGGRGILVCDEWRGREGFDRFLAHIGPRPDPTLTLERPDNDRGYEPGNVRWATRSAQSSNQARWRNRPARPPKPPPRAEVPERYLRDIVRVEPWAPRSTMRTYVLSCGHRQERRAKYRVRVVCDACIADDASRPRTVRALNASNASTDRVSSGRVLP